MTCFFVDQQIELAPRNVQWPIVEHLVSGHPAKLESTEPVKVEDDVETLMYCLLRLVASLPHEAETNIF